MAAKWSHMVIATLPVQHAEQLKRGSKTDLLLLRYMLIKGVPKLAHHLRSLVEIVSHYSYRLQPDASLLPNSAGVDPLHQASPFRNGLRTALEHAFVPRTHPQGDSHLQQSHQQTVQPSVHDPVSSTTGDVGAHGQASLPQHQSQLLSAASDILGRQDWQHLLPWLGLHRQHQPDSFPSVRRLAPGAAHTLPSASAAEALSDPASLERDQGSPGASGDGGPDTWVLPLVQYGAAGLRQDESCTRRFLVHHQTLCPEAAWYWCKQPWTTAEELSALCC